MRAQQRAGRLRQYLARRHQGLNSSSEDVARAADIELALSASLPFRHLRSAVHHLAQIKELPASEAELALANLTLLNQLAEASAAATAAATAATADGEAVVVPHSNMPPSVWYGDPLLSTSNSRHCVEVSRPPFAACCPPQLCFAVDSWYGSLLCWAAAFTLAPMPRHTGACFARGMLRWSSYWWTSSARTGACFCMADRWCVAMWRAGR